MFDWLWIVLIVIAAIILTAGAYVLANKKNIFKKREKKPKTKTKKAAKVKEKPLPPPPPPKEDVVFEEKTKKKENSFVAENEQYTPSIEFTKSGETYTPIASIQVARRRPRPPMSQQPTKTEDDFDSFRRKHGYSNFYKQSIREQIQNLSPEMKAILFGSVLDKKDDDMF